MYRKPSACARHHLLLPVLCVALVLIRPGDVARSQPNAPGRAMVPQDLLTVHAIKATAFSPDGMWAAIVIQRPKKVGESYEPGYLGGLERSDVWLASTDGKTLINVTRGEAVHAGYWNPLWSPDGKRLAMVSTRGDNVHAYVYDLSTQRLRACTTDGVDLGLSIETLENKTSTMAWLGSNQLLLGVLPPGIRSLAMDESERTFRIAAKAMADVKRGRGVTASILDTEQVEHPSAQQKNVSLSLIDLASNKTRIVTRIPLIETRLSQRIVSISPDHKSAAILATDYPSTVDPDRPPRTEDITRLRLGVANLTKTNTVPAWVPNVRPATFSLAVIPTSMRWAPSGSTFAFIGTSVNDVAPAVFNVRGDQEKPEAVAAVKYDPGDKQFLTAEDVQWSASGDLLVYGYAGDRSSLDAEVSLKDVRGFALDNSRETAKRDWWIVSSAGSYHKLTGEMAQSPRSLFKIQNSNLMAGASTGRVWAIDPAARTAKALSDAASIVSPRPADAHRPTDHLVITQSSAGGSELLRLDLIGGAPVKLGTMPAGSVFAGYSPKRRLLAYESENTELRLLDARAHGPKSITLVSLNRQLDAIAKPQYRTIQYQTAEGKQLTGALLLPYGYTAGHRYPLVVSVYGGSVPPTGDWANPYKWRSRDYPDPLVLAGHGYAVLYPSVPLAPMGVQSDPMLELDKGVKPAVEKVVEMGIADPDRTGLMGFSYGGYSVYALVTQTGRFKAAVALAGVNDLLSAYGRLDIRYRFSDVPNPLWAPFLVEAHQMRMGVPPWKDLDRYLRNSPYVHVDKVTTPLLMIHGELDAHPLSEAEQFFVALNRLGKRAKLVRYLAEGHSIESPGNVLDMYEHIFNWFDEFLLNRQPNQSAKTK